MGSHPSDSSGRPCARCGSVIAPGARFCGHCGLTVSGEPSPLPPARLDDHGAPSAGTEPVSDLVGDFSLAAPWGNCPIRRRATRCCLPVS